MFPTTLPFQLALLLSYFSFLFPSTTALPLPLAKAIPKAHTCLTFDSPLDISSLNFIDHARCSFHSYPFCAGYPTFFPSSGAPDTPNSKIASLFCEFSEGFTTTGPTVQNQNENEAKSGRENLRIDLRRSTSIANRKSNTKRDEIPHQPYPEGIQAGTGNAKLKPWTPPANSWPPKESDGCGGDGPYYASGNGCIGSGRQMRDVDAEGEVGG